MKLALFFTRGVSLELWVRNGLLDREKLLYETHLQNGTLSDVIWLTYGCRDAKIAKELYSSGKLDQRITVKPQPMVFHIPYIGSLIYSFLLPVLNSREIREVDILKTNQLDGAWSAIIAKWLYTKPVIVRCGYVQSQLEKALARLSPARLKAMTWLECLSLKFSSKIVVAAYHNKTYLNMQYGTPLEKQTIIPNYIDVDKFSPAINSRKSEPLDRLLYIGRFSPEKNLDTLVRAAAASKVGLDLVGAGPQQDLLQKLADKCGCDLKILGKFPNSELPNLFNRYRFFTIPSFFEGMPKALVEAMSCGMVCVGTDVTGIRDLIVDGKNGFLASGTDISALSKKISNVIAIPVEQLEKISKQARRDAVTKYSLPAVADLEAQLLSTLMDKT